MKSIANTKLILFLALGVFGGFAQVGHAEKPMTYLTSPDPQDAGFKLVAENRRVMISGFVRLGNRHGDFVNRWIKFGPLYGSKQTWPTTGITVYSFENESDHISVQVVIQATRFGNQVSLQYSDAHGPMMSGEMHDSSVKEFDDWLANLMEGLPCGTILEIIPRDHRK